MFAAATPYRGCIGHCVAQDEKLPLHYAAEKGATLEVMKLLLGVEGNAATATVADKVRRSTNTTARTATPPLPRAPPVLRSSLLLL